MNGTSQRDDDYLKILLEGTTSHNGRDEILEALRHVDQWQSAPEVCIFYQGCGCDLITLACNFVDTHVLSDQSSDVVDSLEAKLQRLEVEELISGLRREENQWSFARIGRRKRVHFTTHPLERLNFIQEFEKPLGAVFEWNCGDSARKQAFWEAIRRELIQDGYVIGSYAPDFGTSNRVAFVLDTSATEPRLKGVECFDLVNSSERDEVLQGARDQGTIPEKPLDNSVVEIDGRAYRLGWGGRNCTAVTKIWSQPLSEFGLQLEKRGTRVCRLIKQRQVNA